MGRELSHLLARLPQTTRDVSARSTVKDRKIIRIARRFGQEYFDGDRKYGYGGYHYDGRWRPVAEDIARYYDLWRTDKMACKVLDVGCAKGFLVRDLMLWCDPYGIDVSRYAIVNCSCAGTTGRLHLGSADDLPFPNKSFDLVLSINTLHNLPRPRLVRALQEIKRVSRGGMFVQVDSYRTPEEKARFEGWVLTAMWHGYPSDWLELFAEAGYGGDYAWTIV